mmetsp:Transcript_4253/g.4779  ORF Transcript_4253/g.4779 Transcript_4253/m.4779 type:complete len:109 (-) Transcript_4253:272-598(-)
MRLLRQQKNIFGPGETKLYGMAEIILGLFDRQVCQLKVIEQVAIALQRKQQRMERNLDLILQSINEAHSHYQKLNSDKMLSVCSSVRFFPSNLRPCWENYKNFAGIHL